jgi:hypothetical protein
MLMTLIASINGPETIWLIADRRISWKTRPPIEDAQKVLLLRRPDGAAILGYAGLGLTAHGTEPSIWMQKVLHKRDVPLDESLDILANAMERELSPHLRELPGAAHTVIVPAFYGDDNGSVARLYTIDLLPCPKHGQGHFVVRRHTMGTRGATIPVTTIGSGGATLLKLMEEPRRRSSLRRLVEASASNRITPQVVSDYLASLNDEVHKANPSVGPRCIVVWRNRLGGTRRGGGWLNYTGRRREYETVFETPAPPFVGSGPGGLYRLMRRHIANESGEPIDATLECEINEQLGLPAVFPNEKLR